MFFPKVAVVGVGLIGGSFALALKQAKLCGHVVGVGRGAANLKLAMARGIIDAVEPDAGRAVADADLVYLATPVSHFEAALLAMKPALKPGAIVTDGGSTKRDVVAAARAGLGAKVHRFVPAHPIAGAEKSGAGAASADLFRGKRLVLAPIPENDEKDVQALAALWTAFGARVSRMTPEEHDSVFGTVSHLPHVLAYALVSDVAGRPEAARLFGYAGAGFRDFTRIASSHPEMWRDICIANRDRLARDIEKFTDELARIETMLQAGDAAALEALFSGARAARERWLNGEYEEK
jgi:prephenate dehydrogenase